MIRFTMGEDAAAGWAVHVNEKDGLLYPVKLGDEDGTELDKLTDCEPSCEGCPRFSLSALTKQKEPKKPKEHKHEWKFQCNRPDCMHLFDKAVRRCNPRGGVWCCPKCLLDGFTIRKAQ